MSCDLLIRVAAAVKDLRRQITDFKADIIRLQDNAKSRDAELAESQRKVMELELLTQQQERRLGRLSELETKLQTLQLQSKSELSKKEACFKRDMDTMRLQLARFNQLENEVGTLAEALKRSTEREKSFRKDFTKQASFNPLICLFGFKCERLFGFKCERFAFVCSASNVNVPLQELGERSKHIDRLNSNITAKDSEISDLQQQVAAPRDLPHPISRAAVARHAQGVV